MKKKAHEKVRPYLMILPAMLGILVFTIYPVIKLIQLSFMNVNMLDDSKTKFVGLENYQKVFARPDFIKSLNNTILYTAAVVILITLLALILAVWLNSKRSAMNSVMQAVVFSPHVVAIVSIALIWQWMMEPNFGLFNYVLKFLGLPTSQWLTSSDTAMACVIAISVWKAVGYDMLIFLAALQGVPKELYESAKLDNAGKWTVFWKITIPMVSPQLFFTLIIRTISSFKVFDTVRVLTEGGPNNATTTLVYTIYREALFNMRIGYSAVIGVVLLVIVGILTAVYFVGLSKKVHYQ
ncbi:MAG: ABC transporter permease [Clostridiales bacterium]|nr:sugar ABC transporter permease [Clostridiales bacterium]PWM42410.1 MAG: ABC transporter permease [Clostridiales bacterium]